MVGFLGVRENQDFVGSLSNRGEMISTKPRHIRTLLAEHLSRFAATLFFEMRWLRFSAFFTQECNRSADNALQNHYSKESCGPFPEDGLQGSSAGNITAAPG